ncbi:MAG: hypothetical protein KA116_05880 [Proteobacteria bacterium]|nr:hypothetical protein [Pseudomonadota bacterium]
MVNMFKNKFCFLLFFLILSTLGVLADDVVKTTSHPKLPPGIVCDRYLGDVAMSNQASMGAISTMSQVDQAVNSIFFSHGNLHQLKAHKGSVKKIGEPNLVGSKEAIFFNQATFANAQTENSALLAQRKVALTKTLDASEQSWVLKGDLDKVASLTGEKLEAAQKYLFSERLSKLQSAIFDQAIREGAYNFHGPGANNFNPSYGTNFFSLYRGSSLEELVLKFPNRFPDIAQRPNSFSANRFFLKYFGGVMPMSEVTTSAMLPAEEAVKKKK